MKEGSNFFGDTFKNRDNVRTLIRFRWKSQPQYLKRSFFLKYIPIHFYINTTSQIKPVEFFQHGKQQALPAQVHSVS